VIDWHANNQGHRQKQVSEVKLWDWGEIVRQYEQIIEQIGGAK